MKPVNKFSDIRNIPLYQAGCETNVSPKNFTYLGEVTIPSKYQCPLEDELILGLSRTENGRYFFENCKKKVLVSLLPVVVYVYEFRSLISNRGISNFLGNKIKDTTLELKEVAWLLKNAEQYLRGRFDDGNNVFIINSKGQQRTVNCGTGLSRLDTYSIDLSTIVYGDKSVLFSKKDLSSI